MPPSTLPGPPEGLSAESTLIRKFYRELLQFNPGGKELYIAQIRDLYDQKGIPDGMLDDPIPTPPSTPTPIPNSDPELKSTPSPAQDPPQLAVSPSNTSESLVPVQKEADPAAALILERVNDQQYITRDEKSVL